MSGKTKQVAVCCGTPLIWTFAFRGSEWFCRKCRRTAPMFGVSTTELTPELEQESEENKAWFRSMSAACIPSGARLKWCHQCEAGEEHLAHASEEQKRASREAYEKLLTQP